ncbi:MAG TPA: hypothetical protein VNG33_07715 [Polyangiaceae bacterium]|nr:hypothetical protein [Polyangiaceae bacterium]
MATRNKSFFTSPVVLAAFGAVLAFAVACGDDDDSSGNPAPKGGSKNTAGSSGKTGASGDSTGGTTSTAGKTGTAGKTSMAGVGNEPATGGAGAGPVETGGAGAGGAGGAPDCVDETDMSCYSCKPKTMDQFLNHCPTTGCEPFDNTKLTSLNKVPKP